MTDIVDRKMRSRMMSGIRGKNTRPEILIRSLLHRAGFRFRLHVKDLPGKPDIVLPKFRVIILVHGCFWHGHGCHLFKWPGTRKKFWETKIHRNMEVDSEAIKNLKDAGWRVAIVWECSIKGRYRIDEQVLAGRLARWIKGKRSVLELKSHEGRRR